MKRMFLRTLGVAALTACVALVPLARAQDKGLVGIAMPTKSSARWIGDGDNMARVLKEFSK